MILNRHRTFRTVVTATAWAVVILSAGIASTAAAQGLSAVETQKLRKIEHLITETERVLQTYPNRDFTPNLMFQLIELYVQQATLDYQRRLSEYDAAQEKFDKNTSLVKPQEPKVNFARAISLAQKLLQQYPDILFRDKVLYRLAVCYQEQGQKKEAAEYFELLSVETDDNAYLEEAYFRIGEHYFEQRQYKKAIDYYQRLIDSWDSPYFDMSLYKLAWAYYNDDNFTEAISTLLVLIEDMTMVEEAAEKDKKRQTDLLNEAIKYVAISFAEFGGTAGVKTFLQEKKQKSFTRKIIEQLVHVFEERNYYDKAIEALNVLIEFYPNHWQAPLYLDQIVTNYENAGDTPKADSVRWHFIDTYGPGTPFLAGLTRADRRQRVLDTAEGYLLQMATLAHRKAQNTRRNADYQKAIEIYQTYLKKFPQHANYPKVLFYLAECLYDVERFSEAANYYYDLMLHFPQSKFREDAAYNRILAYNKLLQADSSTDSVACYLFNFLGAGAQKVEILSARNKSQSQVLQASNDFMLYHPESKRRAEIASNYANILYDLGRLELAKKLYLDVIDQDSTGRFTPAAYLKLARCDFGLADYPAVENWWQRLIAAFPDSARFVNQANTLIASARFKQAEQYVERGDTLKAALAFEDIATSIADTTIAERALFNAALHYQQLGNLPKAIMLFERLSEKLPSSARRAEAYFQAAILSEELQDWPNAAENYLAVYEKTPSSEHAEKSLFYAARCYENAGMLDKAKKYYEAYILVFPEDPDRYLEAAFKKAEFAFQQKRFGEALKNCQFVIDAYENFIRNGQHSAESYFAANAQFMIGEIRFKEFENIKLTRPVKRTLKRKRTKFETVIKAYTEAAKFKVAEWTTAASYKIGQVFEAFADAILASPRPRNLKGDDLQTYNAKLEESVLPFQRKAFDTYAANIRQAKENDLDNYWIAESRKRAEILGKLLGLDVSLPASAGEKSTL